MVLNSDQDSAGDYKDILFVENETNFRVSTDQDRYNEFFVDRAGDYFGLYGYGFPV